MSYPDTWLTRPIRRLFMGFLILLFLIISPLIILYTIGYRYDTEHNIIKQTGVLTVDITPSDAQIFINDVLIKKKVPFELRNRAPGSYRVRIEKTGYYAWEKELEIESKQTTYIKGFQLIRQELPTKLFQNLNTITDMAVSNDGAYMLVTNKREDGMFEVFIYETKKDMQTPLVESFTEPTIDFSPYDTTALVGHSDKQVSTYTYDLFDATRPETRQSLVTGKNPHGREHVWIKEKQHSSVALTQNNLVNILNLEGRERLGLVVHDIFGVTPEHIVWEYDEIQNALISKDSLIPLTQKISEIINFGTDLLFARTEKGILIYNLKKYKEDPNSSNIETVIPVDHIIYDTDRDEWLAWSRAEMWRISEAGQTTLLNRTSMPTEFLFPIDMSGAYGVVANSGISINDPAYYITQTILERADIQHIGINKKERKIFFLGKFANNNTVYQLGY